MKHFICEEIDAVFDKEFFLEKNPPCPNSIIWREKVIGINDLLSSWNDFIRKGKQTKNMRETHLERAGIKGSWGVGRQYFKVKDELGREIVLYYDRAPKNVSDKKGRWVLLSIDSI
jgi:hypothetical protein